MTALIPNPTKPRVVRDVTQPDRPWHVTCPCTFEWHSEHHRIALLLATEHTHRKAA